MQKKARKLIENDFALNKSNEHVELKFLSNISKTKVYISLKTGLVFHKVDKNSSTIVNEWSKKVYSHKMDQRVKLYLVYRRLSNSSFGECRLGIFLY